MSSGIFNGKQIALDLSFDVGFKKKCEIKNCVTSNGGIISYIVTKKSSYVVVNDTEKIDISSKCRNAVKYGIPIVDLEFLWKSVEAGRILNVEDFVVGGKSKRQDFKSGKISSSRSISDNNNNKKKSVKIYNIKSCKVWTPDDSNIPDFNEDDFEVAKYTVFHHEDIKKNINMFCCVELHLQPTSEDHQYTYRVFTQSSTKNDKQEINEESEEYRFTNISDEAVYIYKYTYDSFISKKYIPQKHDIPRNIGSRKVQRLIAEESVRKEDLSCSIKRLVDYIWLEATGQLEDILTIPITDIKLQQIDKVEGVLLEIKKCLTENDKNKISSLLSEFYSILPHKTEDKDNIDKRWLSNKQDLCQLIRDMISVTEATNWSIRSSSEAKYKALRCHIQHLDTNNTQFHTIKNHILKSLDNNMKIDIQNIYEVHRPIEDDSFTHKLHPKQLLFHSSKVENFVGLLSRGLLLPKVVVDDFGGKRTDAGLLGSGIYFASSASKSARYSSASNVIGSRFMLVCEVALGNIYKTTQYNSELKQPPEGYNSVHGVGSVDSDFYDDEYVIYNTNQQRVQYLVEFIIDGDNNKTLDITDIDNDIHTQPPSVISQFDNIAIDDIKDIENPLDKVKPGLISTGSDNPVDLKSVHIKARLLDLAAQVIVLQEYYNSSTDSSIEAKYVFPLDDMAAVCGFEAFINGKHIIGEVKEKEIARKEYKEAISEGHGAYLMDRDEETPDIFTVSVGNLPPGACVLIKITYVTELQVEGEEISFRLPGSVAPWKKDSAMHDITQSELDTFNVKQQMSTLQIAVEMPFDIVKLYSPTNKVQIKKTASKAVVKLCDDEQIGDGFQLLIGLNEIHVPRMWVEKTPSDSENRACMLTFYPEFEARENKDCEIIFILDLSNSMTGNGLEDAKKLIYLTLHHLSQKSEFNILVFGTGYEELFTCSVKPTEYNLQTAKHFLKRLCADRGNTELYQPLHSLYLLPPTTTTRNMFIFSDGHINNDDIVLNTASLHSKHSRIFTFAVSSSANVHFLRGLARVSGGSFEYFDRKSKSKWEGKIKDQLNKACQPSLTSVCVEWQQFDDNLPEPIQAPRKITALFNGSRQVVYGFVPNCTLATLKAVIDGEEISTVVSTPDLNITTGQILHRLTARSVIRDWEDGMLSSDKAQHEVIKKNLKEYIINISKEYSLVTQFTSFIAVEKRDDDEKDLKQGRGPQIIDLVNQEDVDILSEISWPDTEQPDILMQDDDKKTIDDMNVRYRKVSLDEDGDDDDDDDSVDNDWCEEGEEEEEEEGDSSSDTNSDTSSDNVNAVTEIGDGVPDEPYMLNRLNVMACSTIDRKADIEEDESDEEMGYNLFDDYEPVDMLYDAVQEKKHLEEEKTITLDKKAIVEEEESDDVEFKMFDADETPEIVCDMNEAMDEILEEKLEEIQEQSASFTTVTAGKSTGGSAQLTADLLDSNITASGVKKPHRFRPGMSQDKGLNKPVNVNEMVEPTSILNKPKRQTGRTTQTARFSTGGKAPQSKEIKITADEEDSVYDYSSTFQQQDKHTLFSEVNQVNSEEKRKSMRGRGSYKNITAPITGRAVRDNLNTAIDDKTLDTDKDSEIPNKPSSGMLNFGQGFGSAGQGFGSAGQGFGSAGQGFGSAGQGFGSAGQGFGSAGQSGAFGNKTVFGSQRFDGNKNFEGNVMFGGGSIFGSAVTGAPFGGSPMLLKSSNAEFDRNKSSTSQSVGSALFGGGSSSTATGFSFGVSAVPQSKVMSSVAPPSENQFSTAFFSGEAEPSSQPMINIPSIFSSARNVNEFLPSDDGGSSSKATGFSFGGSAVPQSKVMSSVAPPSENQFSTSFFSGEAEPSSQPMINIPSIFSPTRNEVKLTANEFLPSDDAFAPPPPFAAPSPFAAPAPFAPPPSPPFAPPFAIAPQPPLPGNLPAFKRSVASVDSIPPPTAPLMRLSVSPPNVSEGSVPLSRSPRMQLCDMISKGVALSKTAAPFPKTHMKNKFPPPPPPPITKSARKLPPLPPSLDSELELLPTARPCPASAEDIPLPKTAVKSTEIQMEKKLQEIRDRQNIPLCPKAPLPLSKRSSESPLSTSLKEKPITYSFKQKELPAKPLSRGDGKIRYRLCVEDRPSDVYYQRSKTRFSDVRGDDRIVQGKSRSRFSDDRGDDHPVEERSTTSFSDVRRDDRTVQGRSRSRFSDDRGDDHPVEERSTTSFSDVRGDDHTEDERSRFRLRDVHEDDQKMRERSRSRSRSGFSNDSDSVVHIEKDCALPNESKKIKKKCVVKKYDAERKVGIKAVSMYNDMTDITFDESLTPCKKLKPDDLTSYGIGVNIPCIRDNDTTLTTQACNQLVTLQSKDGHWSYNSIMEIEMMKCVDLLIKSGVKSLGEKVSDDIMDLLITLIAVLSILEVAWRQLPKTHRQKFIENNHTWKSVIENFTLRSKLLERQETSLLSSVEKGIKFYKIINDKYPLVYYTLELGDDWVSIVTKMLGLSLTSC